MQLTPCCEMYIMMYMKKVSVATARSSLPALLDEVSAGGVVEISRRGKAIALLVAVSSEPDASASYRARLRSFRLKHPSKEAMSSAFFAELRDRSENGR